MSIEVIHLLKFSDSVLYFLPSRLVKNIKIEKRNNLVFISWFSYKTMVSAKEFIPIPICKNNYCSTFAFEMIQVN